MPDIENAATAPAQFALFRVSIKTITASSVAGSIKRPIIIRSHLFPSVFHPGKPPNNPAWRPMDNRAAETMIPNLDSSGSANPAIPEPTAIVVVTTTTSQQSHLAEALMIIEFAILVS